jgi:hypothetical protein
MSAHRSHFPKFVPETEEEEEEEEEGDRRPSSVDTLRKFSYDFPEQRLADKSSIVVHFIPHESCTSKLHFACMQQACLMSYTTRTALVIG